MVILELPYLQHLYFTFDPVFFPTHRYSCDQMFDIISDVEQYCEFLPWCLDSVVLQTHPTKGRLCRLSIGFYPFKESYDSWVTVIQPQHVKVTSLHLGILKCMHCSLFQSYRLVIGVCDI